MVEKEKQIAGTLTLASIALPPTRRASALAATGNKEHGEIGRNPLDRNGQKIQDEDRAAHSQATRRRHPASSDLCAFIAVADVVGPIVVAVTRTPCPKRAEYGRPERFGFLTAGFDGPMLAGGLLVDRMGCVDGWVFAHLRCTD